ncbi:MAG TPA: RsmB/NOP family class I SAM-dependent RNA methyltransferase [Opitutaceae bacterium]|nr:RsmB/NOP family class I SAM-dependent RNA methyltransferase [Opitutaceae bacterium]
MTSAILNQAAAIVRIALAGTPADQALREGLGRSRHRSAPAERRAVSRAVFAYFRWWRWLAPRDSLQKQLAAAAGLQDRFDRDPKSVKAAALAARAVPDWLATEMDAVPADFLRQLQREPRLWIRPKAGREAEVYAALGSVTAAANDALPAAGRNAASYPGPKDLYSTPAFQAGLFEIQDLASQLVGHACAPQPGETWWDACAGEGGKTLHLADLMQNQGLIWASDRSARRLEKLKDRTARAQAFNYRAAPWDGSARLPTRTRFDGILLDAPCSGVGTWQRNPHARWTTRPADVQELAAIQARLLAHAAPALKPGGRLVYSVCTLTRAETSAVASAFASAHPELEPAPVFPGVTEGALAGAAVTVWPHEHDANGMFIAAWRKR